jgi:uncharacterized membrane protein YczE
MEVPALTIFIVCYMLDKIAALALKEPPQWVIRLVIWIFGVVLVIIGSFGPISLG